MSSYDFTNLCPSPAFSYRMVSDFSVVIGTGQSHEIVWELSRCSSVWVFVIVLPFSMELLFIETSLYGVHTRCSTNCMWDAPKGQPLHYPCCFGTSHTTQVEVSGFWSRKSLFIVNWVSWENPCLEETSYQPSNHQQIIDAELGLWELAMNMACCMTMYI